MRMARKIRKMLGLALAAMIAMGFGGAGCSDPGSTVIEAPTIAGRVVVQDVSHQPPMDNPRSKMWDSVTTSVITLGTDSSHTDFFGEASVYLKAVRFGGRLYLRAEWGDLTRSVEPNGIVHYIVISTDTLTHLTDTARFWTQNPSYLVVITPGDTTIYRHDEDRMALMWDQGDNGTEKADCATMCHAADNRSTLGHRMYTTGGGHVDVWHWQAATSDPVLLAADEYWDFEGRKVDDNAVPIITSNYDPVAEVPYFSHRDTTSFIGTNLFSDSTVAFRDSLNWPNGYVMPGYILYPAASGSIADVGAFSTYNTAYGTGRWIVVMSRALTTGNADDVDLGAIAPGDSVMVTLALMNNADRVHSGSKPFYFIFP